jgi:hypothetical protein
MPSLVQRAMDLSHPGLWRENSGTAHQTSVMSR